jgi:fatty acid desaturase
MNCAPIHHNLLQEAMALHRNGQQRALILLIAWACGVVSAVFTMIASLYLHLAPWTSLPISLVLGIQAGRVGFAIYKRIKRT